MCFCTHLSIYSQFVNFFSAPQIASPCSSPEIPSQVLAVQAEVHHPLDWSPLCSEEERLRRKRIASTKVDGNDAPQISTNCNEFIEPIVKRINQDEVEHSPAREINTEESLEASANRSSSPIHIVGPVSMRGPSNDSGVNSANESHKLWSLSLSSCNENSRNSSVNNENSNNENNSLSSNNSHEIVGPVSVRRPINDSGVVITNSNEEEASLSWDFNMDHDNSMEWDDEDTGGSHVPFALSNVANQIRNAYSGGDDDDHSEPSI